MPRTRQVLAEMVATVLEVRVADGDPVELGETLLLMESMKMEIPVLAETAGVVQDIRVNEGDVVQEGDELLRIQT